MLQTGLVSLPDEILQRFSLTVLWLDHNKLSRLPPEFALLTLLEARHPAPVANQSAHRLQLRVTVANQRHGCKSAKQLQISAPDANPRNSCKSVQRLQIRTAVGNLHSGCKSVRASVANQRNGCNSTQRLQIRAPVPAERHVAM
jgi:hypothetical protein